MKKIVSLFQRNYDGDRLVRNEVVAGAEWVLAGEGIPTKKFDGSACMVRNGKLYKRHEVKDGRTPPANFEPANEVDPATGKRQGWVPVGDGPDDIWHREAFGSGEVAIVGFARSSGIPFYGPITDGTYELCGPKIQNNPEGFERHELVRHGCVQLDDCPRDFDGLKQYLFDRPKMEGIVWWDIFNDRMVKIKRKDFFKN